MHVYEVLLIKDEVTEDEWRILSLALAKHIKGLRPFTIAIAFKENLVRYFIISKKDISRLSSGIEGVKLIAADADSQKLLDKPTAESRIHILKIPAGGNLFDLKERYKVQDSLDLFLVFIDVQRLGDKLSAKLHAYFKLGDITKVAHQQLALFPTNLLKIDYDVSTNYLRKTPPKYLSLEKTMHILSADNVNALFSVDGFPYFQQNYYLNLTSYEFDKHSFIIGASGSGKSKFISLFVDRLQNTQLKMNYRVIVIDPHASLAADFQHMPDHKVVDFAKDESTDLFSGAAADISAATELTATLFKSLLGDQFNAHLDRTLRFSLFVLFTAQNMSLDTLKRFLTDIELRNQILEHVSSYVPANITRFFGTDFNELRTQRYNEAVGPIISLVDEMQMQPSLVNEGESSLAKIIQDNFLTVFSLSKVSMGDKVVKTVAGLLIQQIFLLAQARAFNQKVILIIDEVSVVQNPALASILAEARKFNLSVILTQQYFGQIEKDLHDAIFANVYNYYTFKVSEEDARALEGNLNMELPKEIAEAEAEKGVSETEVRVKIMTELHPRECLVRIMAGGQMLPCIKAQTMDAPNSTTGPAASNADLKTYKQTPVSLPQKFVEQASAPAASLATAPIAPAGQLPNEAAIIFAQAAKAKAAKKIKANASQPASSAGITYNLSELLANQSSSRLKINKRKEKV